ncbi:FkbM family methyltransferase [Woodsholea maritima]|uniref:FkbM family methyltransferase n=1 Tax=Woodsholea maritima TaxID=240237 RepID=UPI00036B47DB|nr:FkbM family methyltransferase [Woodsholea maritima]
MSIARHIRALQSRFPALANAKADLQRAVRQTLKIPFERDFAILPQLTLPAASDIVDIGANRGQSIDAIRLFNTHAPLHSFEPDPTLFAALERRHRNTPGLHLHNVGLGEAARDIPLFTPTYRGYVYDGLASFSREEASTWLNAETLANFDPQALAIRETVCEIRTLDSFNLAPSFIKIDVQGFEAQALLGGEATLKTHKPYILLENNPKADEVLLGWGWTRTRITPALDLEPGAWGDLNTLYIAPQR